MPQESLWLQSHFRSLLLSPPTASDSLFDSLFATDATGIVAGRTVSREGIRTALRAFQREWNSASSRWGRATCLDGFVATHCNFMPRHACEYTEVVATALIKPEGGKDRISSLELDGEENLFSGLSS